MENILFNKKTRVSFNLSLPTGHKLLTYTTHQAKQSRSPRARCESREPGSLSLACVSLRNKKQGWRLNAFFADVARRMLTRFCKVWVARIAVSTEAAIPLKKKKLATNWDKETGKSGVFVFDGSQVLFINAAIPKAKTKKC